MAPSPKNATATLPVRFADSAAPVAAPIDAPTMPKQPTRPCSRSTTFIDPARPPQMPVARPSISATSRSGSVPAASAWPWPR